MGNFEVLPEAFLDAPARQSRRAAQESGHKDTQVLVLEILREVGGSINFAVMMYVPHPIIKYNIGTL